MQADWLKIELLNFWMPCNKHIIYIRLFSSQKLFEIKKIKIIEINKIILYNPIIKIWNIRFLWLKTRKYALPVMLSFEAKMFYLYPLAFKYHFCLSKSVKQTRKQ